MRVDPKTEAELAQITEASIDDLRARWRVLYGHEAPKRLSRRFLELGVAYRLQEKAFGGLSEQTRALLRRYAEEIRVNGRLTITPCAPRLKPGVRLLRTWRDETHVVTVLEDGFVYRDQRFGSLSHIARTITGVRRSGPAFFGLKGERTRAVNGARLEGV